MSGLLTPTRFGRQRAGRGLLDSLQTVSAVLEAAQTNVFVADRDLNLVYMNERAQQTMLGIEPEVQKSFGVGFRDLLYGSIHRFHKDPARIERILRDPANFPHEASFSFGDTTLATNINGVVVDGTLQGYVVTWEDVSEQRDVQQAVRSTARVLATASHDLETLAQAVEASATTTGEQASAAAAAAEQMTSSIQEIARSTSLAASMAGNTVDVAASADNSVGQLAGSSAEIGGIVRLINAVAEQTKLLALNATIEAARAGEAGKGFAVVANEVKDLARETAEATTRISAMIGAIQTETVDVTAAITTIAGLIRDIGDQNNTIASAVEEQTATANEIASNVSGVATAAVETTTSVSQILAAAAELRTRAEELRSYVDK